jgi:hypothetical protein
MRHEVSLNLQAAKAQNAQLIKRAELLQAELLAAKSSGWEVARAAEDAAATNICLSAEKAELQQRLAFAKQQLAERCRTSVGQIRMLCSMFLDPTLSPCSFQTVVSAFALG